MALLRLNLKLSVISLFSLKALANKLLFLFYLFIYILLNLFGWHWLRKLFRFQV